MPKSHLTPANPHNKVCRRCLEEMTADKFGRNRWRKDGLNHYCKRCNVLNTRESEKRHPHLKARFIKSWHKNSIKREKKRSIKQRFLRESRFRPMFNQQDGRCAICGSQGVKLCIDHCHKTGKIRGLLCNYCNTAIGSLFDDPEIMKKAIEYVTQGGFISPFPE